MAQDGTGRVVVVAGGTKGIGLAITRQFSALGDTVVIGARRSRPEVEQLANVNFVMADMSDPAGPAAMVGHAERAFGRVDVLVNNVGGGDLRQDPASVSDEAWAETLNRSFLYAVRSCRAAVPLMRRQGGGTIVNISTVVSRMADPGVIDYAAAKAALESYTKSLSAALAPDRIRVNSISPGPVMTPLWTEPGGLADQFAQKMGTSGDVAMTEFAKHVPLGRFAHPDEIAAMVVYLASTPAEIITGTNIRIDGGMNMAV